MYGASYTVRGPLHLLRWKTSLWVSDFLLLKHLKNFILDSTPPGVPMGTKPDACDNSLVSKISWSISHEFLWESGWSAQYQAAFSSTCTETKPLGHVAIHQEMYSTEFSRCWSRDQKVDIKSRYTVLLTQTHQWTPNRSVHIPMQDHK